MRLFALDVFPVLGREKFLERIKMILHKIYNNLMII